MEFTRKLFATSMIVAGGAISVALALSPAAAAQPAPAPVPPAVPGMPMMNQLANAPQLLQGLASALTGTATPAPVTPAPTATAALTLPQSPLPATPAMAPSTAPALATPAAPGLLPTGQVNVPDVPLLPVPLPQQVSFPGDLASLMPFGGLMPNYSSTPAVPATASVAPATAPVAPATTPATSAAGLAPLLIPLSGLP